MQFALDLRETEIAKAVFEDRCDDVDALDELFLVVIKSLGKHSPKQFSALKIDEWKDRFFALDTRDKSDVLKNLFAIGNGKANRISLVLVGGGKSVGNMQPTYSKILTKGDGITFVDQSITGMFERRTHLGL